MKHAVSRRFALAGITAVAFAGSAAQASGALSGNYRVEGRNPNGSGYSGTLTMVHDGTTAALTWKVGNDTYTGVGQLEGRVLTVNWGSSAPVIYVVMDDGSLHGTWADGTALEKLSPQ